LTHNEGMARTVPVTVKVADLPAAEVAIADAVAAAAAEERRRFVILARATCACQSCKDGIAALLDSGNTTGLLDAGCNSRPAHGPDSCPKADKPPPGTRRSPPPVP
jgi:hypothetical protein